MLNDIWTIVQNHVCNLYSSPCRLAITSDSYISGTFASQKRGHSSLLSQAGESSLLNTCSSGAEEAASAKYFLASLESAWNWASAVF